MALTSPKMWELVTVGFTVAVCDTVRNFNRVAKRQRTPAGLAVTPPGALASSGSTATGSDPPPQLEVTPSRALTELLFPTSAALRARNGGAANGAFTKDYAPEELPLRQLDGRVRSKFGTDSANVVLVLSGVDILRRLLQERLQVRVTASRAAQEQLTSRKTTYASTLRCVAAPGPAPGPIPTGSGSGSGSGSGASPQAASANPQDPCAGFSLLDALLCLAMCDAPVTAWVSEDRPPASGAASDPPAAPDAGASGTMPVAEGAHHIRTALLSYAFKLHRETGCAVHLVFPSEATVMAVCSRDDPSRRAVETRVRNALKAQCGAHMSVLDAVGRPATAAKGTGYVCFNKCGVCTSS